MITFSPFLIELFKNQSESMSNDEDFYNQDFDFDEGDEDWGDNYDEDGCDEWGDDYTEILNMKAPSLLPIDSIISIDDVPHESLVNGYLREICEVQQNIVPLSIINLCFTFYLNVSELHRADDFILTFTERAARTLGVPS